jgi:hypothetical protein
MQAAGGVALAALIVVVGALVYLHIVPSGLSPVRNAVSQYGITRFRAGYRVATIAFAISGAALALAISRATHGHASATIVLLVVFAAARAVISWYPMDAPGGDRTSTGRAHGLLAIAAFAGVTAAALRLASVLSDQTALHELAPVSRGLGILMLVLLLSMGFSRSHPELGRRFGLIERGFYVAAIAWFAALSIGCIAR